MQIIKQILIDRCFEANFSNNTALGKAYRKKHTIEDATQCSIAERLIAEDKQSVLVIA